MAENLGTAPPPTLAALLSELESVGGCEISFLNLLKTFAFFDVEKDRVAVRIGLAQPCDVKPYRVTQLGVWLPIPPPCAPLSTPRTPARPAS